MPVAVVFETHSISEDNEARVATGWLGGRLSDAGREQAFLLGERRRRDGLDVVFTSDLNRALRPLRSLSVPATYRCFWTGGYVSATTVG